VIPALGLLVGLAAGLFLHPAVPLALQPYLPIAVIAALDAVFGGVRAVLDGIFNDKVFVVSFLSNVVVAAFIVFLGDQLGVGSQLSTGVVVVLGIRIFSNVASIRPTPVSRMSPTDPPPTAPDTGEDSFVWQRLALMARPRATKANALAALLGHPPRLRRGNPGPSEPGSGPGVVATGRSRHHSGQRDPAVCPPGPERPRAPGHP